jgi:hypothetical protein
VGSVAPLPPPDEVQGRPIPPPPARVTNRVAYIPPQCFATTRGADGKSYDPCYTCHTRSVVPNDVNDDDLQQSLSFPTPAQRNPWRNLLDPPIVHAAPLADDAVLAYVRTGNYFDASGTIALADALAKLPREWDNNGNGRWDGYVPDAWFTFDDEGFDHRPDGSLTGWRAFAYYPVPGAFLPTNGSFDDTLIRLDPVLRQDEHGREDIGVYAVNLAIVESLVRRADVPIDATDERALGVDLDLDGRLGTATRVAFDTKAGPAGETRMHYVGLGKVKQAKGEMPLAPGLYPLGTELLHTLRYLDVRPDGSVAMAARMKEVRFAHKAQWASYAIARSRVIRENREQDEAADGTHEVHVSAERGVLTDHGWILQGFIEDARGALRPQSVDETAYCEGCHGGVGATTDGTFALPRKLSGDAPTDGWFHPAQHDWRGVREPRRTDGRYEYSLYLSEAGGGDDRRENDEIRDRFFDASGALRPDAVARLHGDVSTLLVPSASRAVALDRAYMAIVAAQSYPLGRDPILAPSKNVLDSVPIGAKTGVTAAVAQAPLRP